MATSTSTQSRRTPTSSPLLQPQTYAHIVGLSAQQAQFALDSQQSALLQQCFSTSQDEAQQQENTSLPSAGTVLRNLMARHTQDIREVVQDIYPRVGQQASVKRAFREFYAKEAAHIFEFLDKPLLQNQPFFQSVQLVKRFGKGEYTGNKNKYRDLVLDCSCTEIVAEIQQTIQSAGKSSNDPFENWIQQTRTLLDLWRQAMTEFSAAETKLKVHMTIFDDIQKRATTVLQLPNGETYEPLTKAMEEYLRSVFQEHTIEADYNETIKALKKIVVLTDALGAIRQMVNANTEPLCSVCIQDAVSIATVPCGHTFCANCGARQMTTCYICRTPISNRLKIFFS
jgi:hypothetical protein